MGDVINLREPHEGPRARVEVVDVDGQYVVGVRYYDGSYVYAGAFPDYGRALEIACGKARLLELGVIDLSSAPPDPPGGGEAA